MPLHVGSVHLPATLQTLEPTQASSPKVQGLVHGLPGCNFKGEDKWRCFAGSQAPKKPLEGARPARGALKEGHALPGQWPNLPSQLGHPEPGPASWVQRRTETVATLTQA